MFTTCPVCKGSGIPLGIMIFKIEQCRCCSGTGMIDENDCSDDLWELIEEDKP